VNLRTPPAQCKHLKSKVQMTTVEALSADFIRLTLPSGTPFW